EEDGKLVLGGAAIPVYGDHPHCLRRLENETHISQRHSQCFSNFTQCRDPGFASVLTLVQEPKDSVAWLCHHLVIAIPAADRRPPRPDEEGDKRDRGQLCRYH